MGAPDLRIFQIYNVEDTTKRLTIRGLAVQEDLFVISNIEATPEWIEDLTERDEDGVLVLSPGDPRMTVGMQVGDTISSLDIAAHFESLMPDTIGITNGYTGEELS